MASFNQATSLLDLIFRPNSARNGPTDQFGFVYANTSGYTQSGENVDTYNLLDDATMVTGINAIAKGISQIPFEVRRKMPDGSKEYQPDHPIQILLDKPNVFQTPSEFKQNIVTSILINGNCFLRIIRAGGRAVQLVPMDPQDIVMGSTTGGFPSYTHEHFGEIPAEDIIHIRDVVTWVPQGSSRCILAAERIGALRAADKLIAKTFRDGVSINYAVTTEASVEPDTAHEFSKALSEAFGQQGRNTGGVVFLGDGAQISTLKGTTPADADLRSLRENLIREIAALLGVPAYLLGVSGDERYNSIRQKTASFTRDTLMPIMIAIQEAMTLKLMDNRSDIVEFNPTDFIKGAINETEQVATSLVSNGIMTPNEARLFMDMNPVDDPNADLLIAPNSSSNTNVNEEEPTGGEDGPQSLDNRPDRDPSVGGVDTNDG